MVDTNTTWGPLALLGAIVFGVIVVTLLAFLLGLAGGVVGYSVAFALNELFAWGLPYDEAVMFGAIVGILSGGSSYERGE